MVSLREFVYPAVAPVPVQQRKPTLQEVLPWFLLHRATGEDVFVQKLRELSPQVATIAHRRQLEREFERRRFLRTFVQPIALVGAAAGLNWLVARYGSVGLNALWQGMGRPIVRVFTAGPLPVATEVATVVGSGAAAAGGAARFWSWWKKSDIRRFIRRVEDGGIWWMKQGMP